MLPHSRDTRFVSGGLVLSHGLPLPWLLGIFLFITVSSKLTVILLVLFSVCLLCLIFVDLPGVVRIWFSSNLEKFWPRIFKKLRIFFKCFISPAPLLHSSWTSIAMVTENCPTALKCSFYFLLNYFFYISYWLFFIAIFPCLLFFPSVTSTLLLIEFGIFNKIFF